MESMAKCPWGTARTWCSLLGHLCPSSDMANGEVFPNPVHPSGMAQSPTQFCHGISASTGRDATLHAPTKRVQKKRDELKVPHPQVNMQCLWPEASRMGLE